MSRAVGVNKTGQNAIETIEKRGETGADTVAKQGKIMYALFAEEEKSNQLIFNYMCFLFGLCLNGRKVIINGSDLSKVEINSYIDGFEQKLDTGNRKAGSLLLAVQNDSIVINCIFKK